MIASSPITKNMESSSVTGSVSVPDAHSTDEMYDHASEIFRVMSAPMRLKIIHALCDQEKNVGQLLELINTTQPNMSQHLQTLYTAGIVAKRRDGVQIYYRIANDNIVSLCRLVCSQVATDRGLPHA